MLRVRLRASLRSSSCGKRGVLHSITLMGLPPFCGLYAVFVSFSGVPLRGAMKEFPCISSLYAQGRRGNRGARAAGSMRE